MRPVSLRSRKDREGRGFSLVELLVALVFTMLLMAGMASVFRASINNFSISGEKLSAARRNRMSVDMLVDDLNSAGMLLTSLSDYSGMDGTLTLNTTNPGFCIVPNVAYASTDVASPNNVSDQLFLYYDDPLPFEGVVNSGGSSTSQAVDAVYTTGSTYVVALQDSQQAAQVATAFSQATTASPLVLVRRADAAHPKAIASLTTTGSQVNLSLDTSLTSVGSTSETAIPSGSQTLFVRPGRYVRYSIQGRALDPANPTQAVPCLVRDEWTYSSVASSTTLPTPDVTAILSENVVGFQVMVSPDGGATWMNDPNDATQRSGAAPSASTPGLSHTKWTTWAEIRNLLNASSAITTRPSPNNVISDDKFWFKDIPMLVRIDVATRVAVPRAEYLQNVPSTIINGTGGVPYKITTQSLVIVPRHFGLSYNSGLL
nr:hypothetical protein [uncultured Holophaga sp.]